MPACHAGGRGFEPLLGRHFPLTAVGHRAGVAQLAEQLICNQQVAGSSPFTGSTFSRFVCLRMDGFPSGQREQTVNLPSQTSMVRIHPHPPMVPPFAGMAELADAQDSGSCEGFLHAGSSPVSRTKAKRRPERVASLLFEVK